MQTLIGFAIYKHLVDIQYMVCAGQVLLHLLKVRSDAGIGGVFLCINGTVLQGDIHLRPCKGGGLCPYCGPEGHMVCIFHGAYLQGGKYA